MFIVDLDLKNTRRILSDGYDMNMYVAVIKPMKGKALRKHSLHEKTAASVLLKLFISSNE